MDINICQQNCDFLPKYYSNLTKGIDDSYSELNLNSLENTINFLFHNDYFIYSDDMISTLSQYNAFEDWELRLKRKLKINLKPALCISEFTCQKQFLFFIKSKFLSFYSTSEFIISNIIFDGRDVILDYNKYKGSFCYNSVEGCCFLNNFTKIGDDCYININNRNKVSQMVFFNFSKIDSNYIIKFTKFTNFISVHNDIYLNSVIYVYNCSLSIFNSEFSFNYAKSSLITALEKSNIMISNSIFIDYNPLQFYESSSFSYLFIMGKGVISFISLNNTIKNGTFIINSNSRVNIFDKNLIYMIPTNTYDKLYNDNNGVFKFSSYLNCEIRNSLFYGITNIDKNIVISKIILFYMDGYTNTLINNTIFSNFWLQEGTILKMNNYNSFNLTNSNFININHTCNENPSSLCIYSVFKIESYNSLRFQNITFKTLIVKNEIGFISFNTFNNIYWNIVSIRNLDYICAKPPLINFNGFNQIEMTNIYLKEFFFSATNNFFNLGAFNNFKISLSVLSNNSSKITSTNLIFAASTNTIVFNNSIIVNFTSPYTSISMIVAGNTLTFDNCKFFDIKAVYGTILLVMDASNKVNFYNCLTNNLFASVAGSLFYTMGSKTLLNIQNSVFISAKTYLQGGLLYFETGHKAIIKNSIFFKMESQMTGGTMTGIASNSFEFNNITVLSSISLSNGGFIYLTQDNNITIYNSRINNSGSTNGQGGILFSFQNNNIELINNNFTNCYSEQEGGSFFIDYKNFIILKEIFIYNSISRSDGGFIFLKQTNVFKVTNLIINSTFAAFAAGFLKAQKNNTLEMKNISFRSITALKEGGIYYIDINNNLKISNNNGTKLKSGYGSVICSSVKNTIEILSSNFSEIYSLSSGGSFYFFEENNFFVTNSYFFGIDSGIGNGGFLYASDINFINISLLTIINVCSKSKGGLLYLKNQNNVFINSSITVNVSANEEGSTLFLGYKNIVFFKDNSMNYSEFINAFSFNSSNNIFFIKNIFNVKSAKYNKNFILSYINNIFESQFDEINFKNSEENSIILFLLFEINEFKLFRTKIFIDVCQRFFSIFKNSILYIDYFMLNGFNSNFLESLIHVENSLLTFKDILVKNSNFKTFLTSIYSNISINNASFFIQSSQTKLIIIDYTKLTILKSFFKNRDKNLIIYIIEGSNSNVFLKSINVISFYSFPIGSVISSINSNLSIINSFLSFNKAQFSTIFNIKFTDVKNNFSILLKKNIIFENNAKTYAGVINIESIENINVLTNLNKNNIFFNKASIGGIIKTSFLNSLFLNFNKFSKNSAFYPFSLNSNRSKGGVIYCTKLKELKLLSNLFKKNTAQIGGIIYFNDPKKLKIEKLKNKFEDNKAEFYGNEFASSTLKLRFFSLEKNLINSIFHSDSYKKATINKIRSGIEYNDCQIKINGYDYFNQITYNTDEDYLSDYMSIPITETSKNTFFPSIRLGFICFNNIFLRDSFPITGDFEYKLTFPSFELEKLYLLIKFTNCNVGERLTEDLSCSSCPKYQFSFEQDFSRFSDVCKNCENENFYCFGGGNLTIKPGYWRIAEDSYEFYRCPNKYACLGDPRNFSNQKTEYISIYSVSNCDVGYKGILCSECDDNYGFLDGHYCSSCDNESYYLQVIGNIMIRLIFTMYLISVSINMCLSLMSENPKTSRIFASNLLKILTNHIQILGIISGLPISFPSELKSVSDYLMNISPNVSEAFSIECLLKSIGLDISLQYFKMCFSGIYPFLIAFFFIFFIKLLLFIKINVITSSTPSLMKISKEKEIGISQIKIFDLVYTVLLLVFLTCYTDISKMTFAMFGCVNIGDGKYTQKLLFSDFRIDCNGSYHKKWILQAATPLLIFFLVGYPSIVILKISKNIKNKKNEHSIFTFTYGYFFYAYKERLFFWDFVILARKLILIFINSFFFSRVTDSVDSYPILIVLTIISLSLLVQIYFKPFEEKFGILNNIEEISLIVSYFSLSIALFYMISNQIETSMILFLFFVSIFLNVFFFAFWIKIYYKFYFKEKIAVIIHSANLRKTISGKKIMIKDLQKIEIKDKCNNNSSIKFKEKNDKDNL